MTLTFTIRKSSNQTCKQKLWWWKSQNIETCVCGLISGLKLKSLIFVSVDAINTSTSTSTTETEMNDFYFKSDINPHTHNASASNILKLIIINQNTNTKGDRHNDEVNKMFAVSPVVHKYVYYASASTQFLIKNKDVLRVFQLRRKCCCIRRNWILSSPQPMALLLLPSSVSTNPTSVRCLITVRQLHALPLPMYNIYGRGYKHTS